MAYVESILQSLRWRSGAVEPPHDQGEMFPHLSINQGYKKVEKSYWETFILAILSNELVKIAAAMQ